MRETKSETIGVEVPSKEIHPHFGIDIEHLPEAKKWNPGDDKKYRVVLEIKMTGKSINEREEKETGYADFDITGIEVLKADKKFKVLYRE